MNLYVSNNIALKHMTNFNSDNDKFSKEKCLHFTMFTGDTDITSLEINRFRNF